MTSYFSKFPNTTYDVAGDGQNLRVVKDLIHKVKFRDIVRNNVLILYPYFVQDGETPEIIASKLYGAADYHWIVLFCNDITNLWTEWPLSYDQFLAYLTKKYGSVETAQSQIHHYEDKYGSVIDVDTYNATISDGATFFYTYDYENNLNEAKKQIRLVDAKFVPTIEAELDRLLTPDKR